MNRNDKFDGAKFGFSNYAYDCWKDQLGSVPVEQIDRFDISEQYEVEAGHFLKLEDGKYAVITESGCSCYDYSDANVDVYDTLAEATTRWEGLRRS